MIGITKDDAFDIVDTISKAREIVFCRDCKYWNKDVYYENENHEKQSCQCRDNNAFWDADDFCSRGEKRDESNKD